MLTRITIAAKLDTGHMSSNVWKRNFGHVRPVKIQIRLRIRAVWSESSLDAYWIAKDVITKTYLYNIDLFKPHFYIVKLDFTAVYNIFLISAQNIDREYSLEPPCEF